MREYFLHSRWQNYQNFSLNNPESKQEEKLNIAKILKDQHDYIQGNLKDLRDNESERQKLETGINELLKLQGKNSETSTEEDKYYSSIKEKLEEKIGIEVDESLGASESTILNYAQIGTAKNIEDKSLGKAITPKQYSDDTIGIGVKTLNEALRRLQAATNNAGKNINNSNIEEFQKELEIVITYFNAINKKELKEFPNLKTQAYILPEEGNGITREQFTKALLSAYSRLTYGSLALKIGDIAEYFGAAAAYRVLLGTEKGIEEIEKMFADDKTGMIRITGGEKTQAVFNSELGKYYTKGTLDKDGNTFYTLNATQDKVDFKIQIDEEDKKTLNFSVKNYKNPGSIHILQGNIYPILEERIEFLYHFLNMITAFEDGEGPGVDNINSIYNKAKQTVGIRALIGGRLIKNNDQIINSDKADYLLVFNNSNKNNPASLYSTKKIGEKILKMAELIGISPDFHQPPRNPYGDMAASRFSNIEVSLHLSMLKNSLK